MPLFKNPQSYNNTDKRTPSSSPSAYRGGSIFSNRRSGSSPSPPRSRTPPDQNGFFGRRRGSPSSDNSGNLGRQNGSIRSGSGSSRSGGFFNMGNRYGVEHDSTIIAARQKVTDAENAEKDADQALLQARGLVREAREHVKILEREAIEEARRAKAKQAEAKVVSKSASGLGRHG